MNELSIGNFILETQSYINTLDRIKQSSLYNGTIKIEVNKLLNLLQNKYKKQMALMFSEEHAELSHNMLRDFEKFNELALHEKALIAQMAEYYSEDPEFWKNNFISFFEKLI